VVRAAVERGDTVKAGQLLVELDTRAASLSAAEAQAALRSLETRHAQAKVDCARVEELERQGAIAAAQAEQTRLQCATAPSDRAMAQARAGLAGVQVSNGRVLAPFPGVVTERLVNVGEYAQPGTPLVSLVDLGRLRLEVAVPEALLGSLPEGAELGFRTAAYPGRIFHGTLRGKGSRVRASSRDVVVDADVENPDRSLLPGMFASVDLPLTPTPAVSLPVEALFERDGRWRVLELREGRLREHVVQVGSEAEGHRAVLQGLEVGVEVVRRPAGLRNGQAATRGGG
jgi:RND family efflux transporter MFP subunit